MQGSSNMCMDALTNLAECGYPNLARGSRMLLQQFVATYQALSADATDNTLAVRTRKHT